jgi:serine/threonine-protein kinase HipA
MGALEVRIGTTRVGLLERFEEWEYRFSYDAAWLRDPQRPVLGQIFEDRRPREMESSGHVPCWFDHLLPPLHSPLRRAVARQAGVEPDDPQTDFELLEYLGEDLPGAVVLTPARARLALAPVPTPRSWSKAPGALNFALAGQQWKLSVRPGERGLVIPVRGESGEWIAKFHDPLFAELPRVELATMRWAGLSGIDVPPMRRAEVSEFAELPEEMPTGDGGVFLIERFDRKAGGGRVHMEDFGQILDRPVGHTQYGAHHEEIAAVLAYLAPDDLCQFCARVVFSALCGNTDGHLKNWSVLYPNGRNAVLSPAYDVIASVLYVPPLEDRMALSLCGSPRFEDVRLESFEPMAEIIGVSFEVVGSWVREAAERTMAAFFDSTAELPFSDAERARLERHLRRVPLTGSRL